MESKVRLKELGTKPDSHVCSKIHQWSHVNALLYPFYYRKVEGIDTEKMSS